MGPGRPELLLLVPVPRAAPGRAATGEEEKVLASCRGAAEPLCCRVCLWQNRAEHNDISLVAMVVHSEKVIKKKYMKVEQAFFLCVEK